MSIAIVIPPPLFETARRHLQGKREQICFFRARASSDEAIALEDIHLLRTTDLEVQTAFHLELTDAARAELIRWAWQADAGLVEAHLHTKKGWAEFSGSDYVGFREWVPHVWWRLPGKPYAALVTDGVDWDGLAWVESPDRAVAVGELVSGDERVRLTGRSARTLDEGNRNARY